MHERISKQIEIQDLALLRKQLVVFSEQKEYFSILYSAKNAQMPAHYSDYDLIAAFDAYDVLFSDEKMAFNDLKTFHKTHQDWIFGAMSYDLKNGIEKLSSQNPDEANFPALFFFVPKVVLLLKGKMLQFLFFETEKRSIEKYIKELKKTKIPSFESSQNIQLKPRISKSEYIDYINQVKQHIFQGNIYELNYCQEFFSYTQINPTQVFLNLLDIASTPFAAYLRIKNHYILSASPERFLKKESQYLISQPIKGTAPRGENKMEDDYIAEQLKNDPKEKAENVMIVDLVRNDLARTAKRGTVKVEELFGVYVFPQVQQLISTVSAQLDEKYNWVDAIKNAYPMGSMTGAPKIKAMQLIDEFETFKRGMYSGSVGYVTPSADFDFNVIIRTLFYNAEKQYLSYGVGGAITALSDPEKEYNECELKALAMKKILMNAE